MGEVKIRIGARDYRVACDDGQEPHLTAVAALLQQEAETLGGKLGQTLPEPRLLLMSGLMVADRLQETTRDLADARRAFEEYSRTDRSTRAAPPPSEAAEAAPEPETAPEPAAEAKPAAKPDAAQPGLFDDSRLVGTLNKRLADAEARAAEAERTVKRLNGELGAAQERVAELEGLLAQGGDGDAAAVSELMARIETAEAEAAETARAAEREIAEARTETEDARAALAAATDRMKTMARALERANAVEDLDEEG